MAVSVNNPSELHTQSLLRQWFYYSLFLLLQQNGARYKCFYTLPREIGRHIWRHYGRGERERQDRIDEQGAIGEFLGVRTVRNGEKRKVASFPPPPAFSFVVPSFPCLRPESLPSSAVFLCLMTSLRPILLCGLGENRRGGVGSVY